MKILRGGIQDGEESERKDLNPDEIDLDTNNDFEKKEIPKEVDYLYIIY